MPGVLPPKPPVRRFPPAWRHANTIPLPKIASPAGRRTGESFAGPARKLEMLNCRSEATMLMKTKARPRKTKPKRTASEALTNRRQTPPMPERTGCNKGLDRGVYFPVRSGVSEFRSAAFPEAGLRILEVSESSDAAFCTCGSPRVSTSFPALRPKTRLKASTLMCSFR